MTGRSVPEWIGATPDTAIPPRVRLRVFEAHGGVCHISGRKIRAGEKWEADHVIAVINGGENRESNLAPALLDKHKAKTAADVRQKADVARKRQKHLGIKTESGRKLQSRGFDKTRRKKLNGTVEVRS
jgi:hypothetical protein